MVTKEIVEVVLTLIDKNDDLGFSTLLNDYPDVINTVPDGITLLYYAIAKNRYEIVKLFCSYDLSKTINKMSFKFRLKDSWQETLYLYKFYRKMGMKKHYETALHLAVRNNNIEIVELLLENN